MASTIGPYFSLYSEPEPIPDAPVEEESMTVMGQRLWRWIPGKGLEGMRAVWESGFMEAKCQETEHEAPFWPTAEARCLCGINAYKLTHLFDEGDLLWARGVNYSLWTATSSADCLPVLGIIELGGEVHEYQKGYRAQYARIVEGTVLTGLPVGEEGLAQLKTQYDAPFRVRSLDDWKEEWEATYGRDREAEAEDQNTNPGAVAPGAVISTSGALAAATIRAYPNLKPLSFGFSASQAPRLSRWQKIRQWWRRQDKFLWGFGAFIAPLILFVVLLLGSMMTDALGWTTVWEFAGYKQEATYNLTGPFD